MTYLVEQAITQVTDDELLIPGGLATPHPSLRDRLARAEEARADERSKRMTAEATAEQLAELIAAEHVNVVAERKGRERAEAALAKAERTAKEMADLVQMQSERADRAEESSRQALTAYLDDPFRPIAGPPSRRERLRAKLRAVSA
jgi:membrane protein involved in colicin uptake